MPSCWRWPQAAWKGGIGVWRCPGLWQHITRRDGDCASLTILPDQPPLEPHRRRHRWNWRRLRLRPIAIVAAEVIVVEGVVCTLARASTELKPRFLRAATGLCAWTLIF